MLKTTARTLGILADTLNFFGSLMLVIETLLKPRTASQRRAILRTLQRFRKREIVVRDRAADVVTDATLEDADIAFGWWLALTGIAFLSTGFLILLAIRIWGP